MVDYDAIKEKYSCIDVARQLGIELQNIGNGEYRGTSLAPGEHSHNNGLAVNSEEWKDFTANVGGSCIDLVAYVKFGSTDKEAIHKAAKFLAGDEYDAHYWQGYTSQRDKFKTDIQAWHEALLQNANALEYLHSRRITDATIERYSIGLMYDSYRQEWRIPVAYLNASKEPVYYASRLLPGQEGHESSDKYVKAKQNDFLKNCPFGLDSIPEKKAERDILAIGEGLFDVLSVLQEGVPALFSIGGGFGSKKNTEKVIAIARTFKRVVTCFDNDINLSGQRFTCRMGKLFLNAGIMFYAVESYGEGHKDVSDYYRDHGSIDALLDGAVSGYAFMSRYSFWENTPVLLADSTPFKGLSANDKATYLAEVKKFIHRLKTLLEPLEFDDILIELRKYYPADKIAKFAEGPTAHEVLCGMRDKFLDGRRVFFHGSTQHGEYWQYDTKGGYWYRMTDADLQGEISAFFGHELDNRTVSQLATMVRLMHTQQVTPEFNKAQVQVFTNGSFELDTGTLREHRPEDFMTWAHGFAYDPSAECPTYDAFLDAIADGQPSRVEFLDDMVAYVLYGDCRLQKVFFLVGNGENGKSTLLDTVKALFESSNARDNAQSVTAIQPNTLDKPTQRILLESSILNVAADIDPNLKGCESYLKAITDGDAIDGNFKFCDGHTFVSRCKLIFSSNAMITVKDISYGMRRKLMFCQFAACFKGKADTQMPAKLKAELPGIFNRVFRAYQALRERERTQGNHAIRESCDQNACLTEFTETANPVAAFWAEQGELLLALSEVKKSEVFDKYRVFCERNGLYAGRENVFHGTLQKVLQDEGITCREEQRREGNARPRYYILRKFKQLEDFIDPDGEGDGLPE